MKGKQEGEDHEGIADNQSIREEVFTLARAFCFIYPDDYSLALFFVKKKLLIFWICFGLLSSVEISMLHSSLRVLCNNSISLNC